MKTHWTLSLYRRKNSPKTESESWCIFNFPWTYIHMLVFKAYMPFIGTFFLPPSFSFFWISIITPGKIEPSVMESPFSCAMSSTLHLLFWLDGHFNYPHFPVEETEVPRGQITCRIHKPIKWRSRIWVQAVWFYNPLFNLVSQSDDVQTSLPSYYKLTFITAQTKTQVRPFESWEMAGEAIIFFLYLSS